MKKLLLVAAMLCSLSFYAQQPAFDYKVQEAKIKKYLYSSPDSTKAVIDYVFSQKNLPDSIRGTAYNVCGIYYDNIGKSDSALYFYNRSLATLKGYPKIMVMPLMNVSIIHRNRGEYQKSFEYLDEALKISKKYGMKAHEANVYSNMASNYQFMLEYTKAVDCLLKGIDILRKENISNHAASLKQKLANTYLKMHNFTFAKDLYLESLKIFKAGNDERNYSLTLINLAECEIHLNKFENAKKALREAIPLLKGFNNMEITGVAYSKLAKIATLEKNTKAALGYYHASFTTLSGINSINSALIAAEYITLLNSLGNYQKSLDIINTTQKLGIFKNINAQDRMQYDIAVAETYKKTKQEKQAVSALDNALKSKDSVSSINDDATTRELQAKLQKQLQQEKNELLAVKNATLKQAIANERRLNVLYIIASVVVIGMILSLLRAYWLKSRLHNIKLKTIEAEKILIEQQHGHEQQLINAQKEIIDEKQKELAAMALRMANYQESLNGVIDKCESNIFAKPNDVKKELLELSRRKDYWEQFETKFNNLHPEFNTTLASRFANLTKNDLEFCTLLKLNLSNKEIASLLQISHESAITKKYRIKKKMEISDDVEFEKVFMDI